MTAGRPDPRPARLGLVSISDRASRGEYQDRSGPAMERYLDAVLISPKEFHRRLIPDHGPLI